VIAGLTFAVYAITINGVHQPKTRAAVASGHVLLPVRALGHYLYADVVYDGRDHSITLRRGTRVATISARRAVVIVNGTAYAPLRTSADAFGVRVAYEAGTRTVALVDPTIAIGDVGDVGPRRPPAPAPAQTQPPTYTVTLTPPVRAVVHEPYPQISARFMGAASIDPSSLSVTLDGREVGDDVQVLGDEVQVTPRTALTPGTHSVAISARDITGGAILQQWSFSDDFTLAPPAPPAPYSIGGVWVDRWVSPGTNAFNVFVAGAPGLTGDVSVDGVGTFPLVASGPHRYVAHILAPSGVAIPFARIRAELTLPGGQLQTIVLPQTLNITTPPRGSKRFTLPTRRLNPPSSLPSVRPTPSPTPKS
jgi:hypothetical protein